MCQKLRILNITKKCFREESKNRSKLKEGMNLATKKQAGKYDIDGESGPQICGVFPPPTQQRCQSLVIDSQSA